MRETHLPAEQPEAQEEARVPSPHAEPRRSRRVAVAPSARPEASQRLTWRVRDRATFLALSRARRVRRGPVSVRFVPAEDPSPARVAYAVGRPVGNAVRRNRVRRRLRAAVGTAEARGLLGSGAYLVGAGREVLTMPAAELEIAVLTALAEAGEVGA